MTKIIEETLTCPICGRSGLQSLTAHITRGHKIPKEQFIKDYPNCKLITDKISNNCSKAYYAGFGKYMDDHEFLSSIAKRAAKTRKPKQKEINRKVVETRRKNNSYHTDLVNRWENNSEYRELRIQQVKNQHKQGLTDIIVAKSGKKRYDITLGDITYSMRSTWETKFAKFLFNNDIDFKFEPFTINYYYNDKLKKYYPDFYIEKYNLVVEVKPSSLTIDNRVQAKRNACINLGYKFMFITEKEIDNLSTIIFEGI